jgi:hypothetical protein
MSTPSISEIVIYAPLPAGLPAKGMAGRYCGEEDVDNNIIFL